MTEWHLRPQDGHPLALLCYPATPTGIMRLPEPNHASRSTPGTHPSVQSSQPHSMKHLKAVRHIRHAAQGPPTPVEAARRTYPPPSLLPPLGFPSARCIPGLP